MTIQTLWLLAIECRVPGPRRAGLEATSLRRNRSRHFIRGGNSTPTTPAVKRGACGSNTGPRWPALFFSRRRSWNISMRSTRSRACCRMTLLDRGICPARLRPGFRSPTPIHSSCREFRKQLAKQFKRRHTAAIESWCKHWTTEGLATYETPAHQAASRSVSHWDPRQRSRTSASAARSFLPISMT